jgi:hypothetical protein
MSNSPSRKICIGICGKRVPLHVTPRNCRNCRNLTNNCKICNIPTASDKVLCYRCFKTEYPRRNCDRCRSTFTEHRTQSTCSICVKYIKINTNIEKFVNILGEIDDDYAIKVKFTTNITSHDGYCSDPDISTIRLDKITDTVYFPATSLVVDSTIDLYDLLSGFKFNDYITAATCNCGKDVYDPTIVSAKLVHKTPHMYLENLRDLYTVDIISHIGL